MVKINSVLDLKDKKILVVGLGRTGVSLIKFLCKHGAQVTASDHKSEAELSDYLKKIKDLGVTLQLEGHPPATFLSQDIIIVSPGVPINIKLFDHIKSKGILVTGEFEFCSTFVKEPMIVITGTNGKTTVAQLTYQFLTNSGVKTWIGGNYGQPLSEYLYLEEPADVLVVEASSYMLEHIKRMVPNCIVFTNFAESHLDRHKTLNTYLSTKRKIFLNTYLKTTSILNADDRTVLEVAHDPLVQRGNILYFSRKKTLEPQIMKIGGAVMIGDKIHVRTGPEIEYYSMENVKVVGDHTYENIMAAILASREYGAKWDSIQETLMTYRSQSHRMEYVRKVGGVTFYNDSKATNVHAVMRAIDSFEESLILIMGGKDGHLNFEPLKERIQRKVKNLILVGESKEKINRHIGNYSETFLIGTFEEAVLIAYQKSRIGDTVILSPGCSSFDSFNSYQERGELFKELVNQFK